IVWKLVDGYAGGTTVSDWCETQWASAPNGIILQVETTGTLTGTLSVHLSLEEPDGRVLKVYGAYGSGGGGLIPSDTITKYVTVGGSQLVDVASGTGGASVSMTNTQTKMAYLAIKSRFLRVSWVGSTSDANANVVVRVLVNKNYTGVH